MINEFKKFIMCGNILDISIGIIIGASFNSIVNSFVQDILMPPIGLILSDIDFSNMFIVIKNGADNIGHYNTIEAAKQAGAVVIVIGTFINSIISFLITAFSIFIIIKLFNKMQEKIVKKEQEDKAASEKICPYCCSSINVNAVRCPNCTSDLN